MRTVPIQRAGLAWITGFRCETRRDFVWSGKASPPRQHQAGFSMLEMLMATFILSIGILGLSMLQVMSLRASRGGRNLTTAVQVAEQVLDQIEMEGRVTWLNVSATQRAGAGITVVPNLKYIPLVNAVSSPYEIPGGFTVKGRAPDSASSDPLDNPASPYFRAFIGRTGPANPAIGGLAVNDYTVTVTFDDTVLAGSTTTVIQRNVVLTRRILHG